MKFQLFLAILVCLAPITVVIAQNPTQIAGAVWLQVYSVFSRSFDSHGDSTLQHDSGNMGFGVARDASIYRSVNNNG